MISQDTIEEVKLKMDVVDVVSVFIPLKKEGAELVACCPFHNEKSPSFKVSKSKQIYKCFGCGKTGDAIAFVQEYEKIGYPEAIRRIAAMVLVEVKDEGQTTDYTLPVLANGIVHESAMAFFTSRGISAKTIEDFGITQSLEWMHKAKAEVPTINFNYFRDGILTNVKYRADNKDFKLAKGAELIFYNMDGAKQKFAERPFVVIVEGEMDALALHEVGVKAVISVPNGAAKSGSNSNLKYLDNCAGYFDGLNEIILCTDDDEPGRQLREELARRLGKERCRIIDFPTGCKDANDVLMKHGKPGVLAMLKTAREFPIEGVISVDDLMDDVQDYFMNGMPKGVRVGIKGFDRLLSFMPGQYTTFTGIPSAGKSEFIDNIMAHAAKNHAWKFGICSFENQPPALHVTKLMEKFAGKAFPHRVDASKRMTLDQFHWAADMVRNHFKFINVNLVEPTLEAILDKAAELILHYGLHCILIDPWNFLEGQMSAQMSETQFTSIMLGKIKAFCLKYGVHIFLVAHPTKMRKEQNGKYEVPTMYSISGSAHFFNKTDNGVAVYRNFDTGIVDVYVQKVRYSWLGEVGMTSFGYDTETRQYTPTEDSDLF